MIGAMHPVTRRPVHSRGRPTLKRKVWRVIILGVILLILGLVLHITILYSIGIILLIVGVILAVLGAIGRGVGGRKHYF
jgi:uncharacterized membrane protein HdeD (DUF308 family)